MITPITCFYYTQVQYHMAIYFRRLIFNTKVGMELRVYEVCFDQSHKEVQNDLVET